MTNLIKDIFETPVMPDLVDRCDSSLTGKWDDFVYHCGEFNKCLEVEKIGQSIADAFYKECMGASNIRRYDYHNPDQKNFQINDIDCSIELDAKTLDIFWLNISEKFRQHEIGDMCLELWSNLEKQIPGWATKEDGPDMYLYVTPKYFFTISHNRWFRDMIDRITKEWTLDKINDFLKEKGDGIDSGSFPITVCGCKGTLIKSITKADKNTWHGVCICIPWVTLLNEFFLDINMYDRNYKKLNINKEYKTCN